MRWVWTFGGLAVLLLGGITVALAPLDPGIVDLQLAFTAHRFGEVIHAWTPDQLALYRAHLPWDGALLLAYAGFGYLLASRTALFRPLPGAWALCARGWLPLAAVFDATENLLHAWLTAAPRFGVPALYALSAGSALLKWLLLVSFGGLVAWALVRAAR